MPHYRNGEEAKVGDLVKGRGYNVQHEIIGKVVNVRPGESCTLPVAYVGADTKVFFRDGTEAGQHFRDCLTQASVEYGDTRSFEKIA
jgi:NDP-sugar pyrophosphorylase family protein